MPPTAADRILTFVLVACAVATTAAVVFRSTTTARGPSGVEFEDEFIADWLDVVETGVPLWGPGRPIQIAEFGDFECAACKIFADVLASFDTAEYPDVGATWIDLPLRIHRFAVPAARAFHCAVATGFAKHYASALFAAHDSLGLKSWDGYARTAGIRDLAGFSACAGRAEVPKQVEEGLRLASKLDIRATPTVIVNGWRFAAPPSEAELRATIEAIRRGDAPFKEFRRRD